MRSRQTGYSSTLDFWKYSVYIPYTPEIALNRKWN